MLRILGSPKRFCDSLTRRDMLLAGGLGLCGLGLDVCELLPNAAKVMDKVTVLRSLTHPYPIHGVAYATTGVPQIDVPMELNPRDGRHWPFIGSAVEYLTAGKSARRDPVPTNVALPWPFSSQRV